MFTPGPIDIVVAVLLSVRRFGVGRTLLGAIVVAIGIQPLLPPVSCSCLRPLLRRCDTTIRYQRTLKSDLKNLASQQEIYFSDALRYAEDFEALAYTWSDGVRVDVRAGEDGWTAWATHATTGPEVGCVMYYGSPPPALGSMAPEWASALRDTQPGEVTCHF